MKDNSSDMHVADKLAKQDTLSAGIVYGKEEAWDKLQARMDKKPARVVLSRYWAAAAAMLLLFAGIVAWYYAPVQEAAIVKHKDVISTPVNVAARQPVATEAQPVAVTEKMATIKMNRAALKNNKVMKEESNVAVTVQDAPVIPEKRSPEIYVVTDVPAPIVPAPMKVIHINDIEKGSYAPLPTERVAVGIALNKLPVVHINEVEREAVEVKEILKNNRMTFGHIPFSKHGYDDPYINTEDHYQPVQFLKLRSTQN